MVKGVNRTVIEVNNTGSKFFEKIVFYVTPQYGNLSAAQLTKAAREFSFRLNEEGQDPGRRVPRLARRRGWLWLALGLAAAGGLAWFLMNKL